MSIEGILTILDAHGITVDGSDIREYMKENCMSHGYMVSDASMVMTFVDYLIKRYDSILDNPQPKRKKAKPA